MTVPSAWNLGDTSPVPPGGYAIASDNCLHHLLPPPRDLAVTSRHRKPTAYIQDQVSEQKDTAQQ